MHPPLGIQVVPLQHALQPISCLDPLLDQAFAVGDQRSKFTNGQRGNPHCRDEVGGEQAGELDRITRIGFDTCGANQLQWKADELQ